MMVSCGQDGLRLASQMLDPDQRKVRALVDRLEKVYILNDLVR